MQFSLASLVTCDWSFFLGGGGGPGEGGECERGCGGCSYRSKSSKWMRLFLCETSAYGTACKLLISQIGGLGGGGVRGDQDIHVLAVCCKIMCFTLCC